MFRNHVLWACVSYAASNTWITLLNKAVFSQHDFIYPWFTLAAQNIIALLFMMLTRVVAKLYVKLKARKQKSELPSNALSPTVVITHSSFIDDELDSSEHCDHASATLIHLSSSNSASNPNSLSNYLVPSSFVSSNLTNSSSTGNNQNGSGSIVKFSSIPSQGGTDSSTSAATKFLLMPWKSLLSNELCREIAIPIFFFVFFIYSNAKSLQYLSLPVVTVFKSLAPIGVTLLERWYFGDYFSIDVYISMALVVLSTLITFAYDLEFSVPGYIWAVTNIFANILYLFTLRLFVADHFSSFEKAFHSTLLSLIPIIPLSIITGELPGALVSLASSTPLFKLGFVVSGMMTLALVSSSFWVLAVTNGSTLSFLGGLNKIPIVVFGYFLFNAQMNLEGWIGVLLGILAGIFFVQRKALLKMKRSNLTARPTSILGIPLSPQPPTKINRSELDLPLLETSLMDSLGRSKSASIVQIESPSEIRIGGAPHHHGKVNHIHQSKPFNLGASVYEADN
eukprot:CAMPEP_0184707128 /NCGR_PEP_ID=MMETSP0313-20130426/37111_1 /TAXON_ID=2792 /ORGANISM="Porphyridium aerugineum, Strain SAG 1380-2" /LENGTH=508 /DNA_ID=CAMNT_0027168701 /DNA_START=214 /DNA_END=1740 /DNA_ORIENTATION=+